MTGTTEMLRKTDNLFRALNSARSSGMNVRTLEDYHRQLKNAAVFAHRKKKEEMSLRIKKEMIPRLVDLDLGLLLQEQKDGINGEFLSYLRRTMPGAICQETLFTLYPRFRQHKVKDKILELVPARPELEFLCVCWLWKCLNRCRNTMYPVPCGPVRNVSKKMEAG